MGAIATPYSEELRRHVLAVYVGGKTTEEVAEGFGVSISAVRNWRALRDDTGGHKGGGNPRSLSPDDERATRHWCEQKPDMTLEECQERFPLSVG